MSQNNTFQTLNRLDKDYNLTSLFKNGILSYSVCFHYEVYLKYDTYLKTGSTKRDAKDLTMNDFDIDINLLNRIIRKMTI